MNISSSCTPFELGISDRLRKSVLFPFPLKKKKGVVSSNFEKLPPKVIQIKFQFGYYTFRILNESLRKKLYFICSFSYTQIHEMKTTTNIKHTKGIIWYASSTIFTKWSSSVLNDSFSILRGLRYKLWFDDCHDFFERQFYETIPTFR